MFSFLQLDVPRIYCSINSLEVRNSAIAQSYEKIPLIRLPGNSEKVEENSQETFEERLVAGRALRKEVSRCLQSEWKTPRHGVNPIAILEDSNKARIPELIPVRHKRMSQSPFTFFRGIDCPHGR